MRFFASSAANTAAWAVVILLIVAAMGLTYRLGFMGLLLLGGLTCLVCTLAELDRNVSTWGVDVFRTQMTRHVSPEQRAAMLEEGRAFVSPLRFYRWCGVILVLLGAAGFAAQLWEAAGAPSP